MVKDMNIKPDPEFNNVTMIDISSKPSSFRTAEAEGMICLSPLTMDALRRGTVTKGNVFATAEIAGILATKKTHDLLPLCHPIPITSVNLVFHLLVDSVKVKCTVNATYKTGVEMEALIGVSTALLTIWDMVKYLEKDEKGQYQTTKIKNIKIIKKVKHE
jgi:cyclic pyranopterin phosphate synthase